MCDHNPPTLQTDRQTDDILIQQYRATHVRASRGNNNSIHQTAPTLYLNGATTTEFNCATCMI